MERLERIWKELMDRKKKKKLEEEEMRESISKAIEQLRSVRWKLDQTLEKYEVDPIFIDHYQTYTREEFLLGAEVSFNKICALIKRLPQQLLDDPEVGPHFIRIRNYYKRIIIFEDKASGYYDGEGIYNWRSLKDIDSPGKGHISDDDSISLRSEEKRKIEGDSLRVLSRRKAFREAADRRKSELTIGLRNVLNISQEQESKPNEDKKLQLKPKQIVIKQSKKQEKSKKGGKQQKGKKVNKKGKEKSKK